MSYTPYFSFPKNAVCVACEEPVHDGEEVHVCFKTKLYQHPNNDYKADFGIEQGMFSCEIGGEAELIHVICPEQRRSK